MGTRPFCNRMAMSVYKEASYGNSLDAASYIDQMFELQEPALIDPTLEFVDDASFLKGHEWPEDTGKRILVAQDAEIPFNFPSSLEVMGLLLAFACGEVSTSGSSDFEHTITMQDACASGKDALPSTSVITGFLGDTASYLQFNGVMINELTINIDSQGWLPVTGTLYTDGEQVDASSYTFPTSFTSSDFVTGANTTFSIGPYGGTYTNYSSIFRGLNFSINNNLDRGDARSNIGAAGIYLSELRFGERQITFNVTVQGHQGDAQWDYLIDGATLMVKAYVEKSATRSIQIELPKCELGNITPGFDGMRDTLELQFDAFYDSTESSPVKLIVMNGVAEYLKST